MSSSKDRYQDDDALITESGRRMPANYKWAVVVMLWFITFFNYADRMALSANLPLLRDAMSLDKAWGGMLGSAFGYSYGLSAIFAGYIVDRVRRKNAVLFGLCIWSLVCMLIASSQGFWMLFIFLALEGMGQAFYFPAAMSMVSDYHGKKTRSRAMGINQTGVYFGTIGGTFLAGLIGSYFAAKKGIDFGWRVPFVIFGVLGIVLGLFLWRFLHEPKRGAADLADLGEGGKAIHRKVRWTEFFGIFFTTPTAILLLCGFFCANFVAVMGLIWMPTFILETFFDSDKAYLATAGLIATLPMQFSSMISAPLAGFTSDRLRSRTSRGRILVQMTGALCAIPFLYLCGQANSILVVIVALAGWGICKGMYDSNIFASVFDVIRPEARGMTTGLMNLCAWAGAGTLAPAITGKIADAIGMRDAISYAAGIYVLAVLLLFIAMKFFVPRDVEKLRLTLLAEAEEG